MKSKNKINNKFLEDLKSKKIEVIKSYKEQRLKNSVTPSGPRNQMYGAIFLRDVSNSEDNTVRAPVALEKLVIREEPHHCNLLSFILNCAGENIQRTATISYEVFDI
ncbi:hypothetical protein BdWA1_001662 [Babesia duncani]|uniref:Uncharacterized protein n=1 Tax=Babesia duncani TaxID=323732 RepID=A0AAD9PKU6_9APIC|nr:hypothetical protein BdWA1_001662 [Babesia duncani]